jgi:hypothetical protein
MNQTSPWLTGGATITAVQLEPLVRWGLTGFHAAMPDAVPGVVAALLFTGAHALLNLLASRMSKTPQ